MITNPFTLSSSSCSNITNSIPTMRVDQRKITGSSSEGISSGRPLLDDDRKTHHLWARFQEINDFETVLQAYNRQYTLEALDDNYPAPSYWLVRCCLMVRFTDGFIGFIPCRLCKDISSTNNKNLKKRLEGHSVMKLKAIKCSFPPSPESPRRFLRFHNCYQGKKEELTVCNYDVSNDNSDKKAEEHQEDSKYDIVMGLTKEDRRKRGRNTKVYIKICDQLQAKTGPKEAFWCPVSTTGIYMKKKKKKKKEHCVFHIFSRNAIASVSYGLYRRNKFQKFVSMAGIPFELKLSPVIEQQHIVATATSSEAVMFPPQLPLNYKHQNHHLKASLSSMYTKSEMKAPPLLMPPQFEPLSAAAAAELPATVTTAATTQTIQTIPQKQKQHATRGIYQNNKAAEEADKGDDDNINDDHQMRKNRPIIESGKRREQETTEPLQQQQQQQGKNENESFLGVAAAITGTTTIGEAPQPPSGEASSSIDLYLPQRPHHPFPSIDSADDDVLDTYNGRMGSAEMIMQLYTTLEVLKHNIQANYLLVELMCSDEWKAVHGLATTFEHDRLPKVFKVMAEKDMNKQQQILQALQQILVDQWVIEPFRSNLAERVKSLLNKGREIEVEYTQIRLNNHDNYHQHHHHQLDNNSDTNKQRQTDQNPSSTLDFISNSSSVSSFPAPPLQQWPLVVRFRFPSERYKLKGYIITTLHQCGIGKLGFLPDEKGSIVIVVGMNVKRDSAIASNLERFNAAQSRFVTYLSSSQFVWTISGDWRAL
eukprot:jgi/Bigna1/89101/estExt_fgenesh1_pg.C_430111